MDDLLKKIRQTESEAQIIIDEAENKARRILEKSRIDSSHKMSEARKTLFTKYSTRKEDALKNAQLEKEARIQKHIETYIQSLGDLGAKKKSARVLLGEKIKKILSI